LEEVTIVAFVRQVLELQPARLARAVAQVAGEEASQPCWRAHLSQQQGQGQPLLRSVRDLNPSFLYLPRYLSGPGKTLVTRPLSRLFWQGLGPQPMGLIAQPEKLMILLPLVIQAMADHVHHWMVDSPRRSGVSRNLSLQLSLYLELAHLVEGVVSHFEAVEAHCLAV
jgi:hypothetical protein